MPKKPFLSKTHMAASSPASESLVPPDAGTEILFHVETPSPHQRLASNKPVSVRGWVMLSGGVREVSVACGSQTKAARHGVYRSDIAQLFPQHAHMFDIGFECSFDPIADCLGETLLTVTVDGQGGEKYEIAVPVFITAERDLIASSVEAANAAETIIVLDRPVVANGVALEPLRGGLEIAGWALSRRAIESIIVELDDVKIGAAYYGMRREDVASIYPGWPNALLSGFAFSLPRRALSAGAQKATVRLVTKSRTEHILTFTFTADAGEEDEGPWTLRRKMPAAEQLLVQSMMTALHRAPHFLIWLPCQDVGLDMLRSTLRSLAEQVYQNWHVVLSGAAQRSDVADMVAHDFVAIETHIHTSAAARKHKKDPQNWVLRSIAGDIFAIDALSELALAIEVNHECDFIYADERRLSRASGQIEAFFKPDWSPHLLMSTNYIGYPWAVRQAILEQTGRKLGDLDSIGDYDLLLELMESAEHIVHVPQVLYERVGDGFDPDGDLKALERMAKRRKLKIAAEPGRIGGSYRLRPKVKIDELVSIIIPTCGTRGLIKRCLTSLKALSSYKKIEIIIIDTIADPANPCKAWLRTQADVVIEVIEPFNWSRLNNLAAREASGVFLLFLNDDTEVIQADWLEAMLEEAVCADVGVVGPQLLYPDGKVQHAGFFLGELNIARHAFRFCDADDPGYFGLGVIRRDVIGVTGACMLMRRDVFDAVGGFDEAHAIVNNDLDFCLKVRAKGLWNIYTPFARLTHHELASRARIKDAYDKILFNGKWASLFHSGDPFFHPHLSCAHDIYQYDAEPNRLVFSGHPYYLKHQIERILVIKVDHIGDFLTAIPAFRRIKTHFPNCRLSVLAAPASVHLAGLEPAIDEIIPFAFFHARSGDGQKHIDQTALETLRTKLAPGKFDLAIDLRKHPETRGLLRYTGAYVTAGFDNDGAFPWLDIARVFEGDKKSAAKHMHITDDLLCLIDQIALAGETERSGLHNSPDFKIKKQDVMSRFAGEEVYTRPLVCIHPASGNEMRQWPPAYFAALADLLIQRNNVNIAIISTLEEREIGELVMSCILRKERVSALIGRVSLSDLPYFLTSCALFVGNNSGPQHLAASLGVPTVGIHSGVVDAIEWGPLGEKSIAVRRQMTCAPCYLSKPEDCHRGLECLTQLSPAMVFAACQRMLALSNV